VVAGTVAAVLVAGEAHALRARSMVLGLQSAQLVGKAKLLTTSTRPDTRLKLALANDDRDTDLLVVFPPCTSEPVRPGVVVADLDKALRGEAAPGDLLPVVPEPAWQACITEKSQLAGVFILPRGSARRVKVAVDFRAAGPQQVKLVADVYALPDGALAKLARVKRPSQAELLALKKIAGFGGKHPISAFYDVAGAGNAASFRIVGGDELTRAHELPREANTGHASADFVPLGTAVDLDSYASDRRVLPAALRHDPTHADLRALLGGGTDERSDSAVRTASERPAPAAGTASVEPGSGFLITGTWSVKWTDTLLHPAWGWNIVAWWNDGGDWIELGNTIVGADGSYAMVVSHPEYSGQHLRMQIRARNPYFEILKENDSVHRYISVDRYDIPVFFDDGSRWIDPGAHGADGLGEVYDAGYQLWHEMYFRAGINPMRADHIHVYFPNTWYECGVGEVWSCATRDGSVWLRPDHDDFDTIQHELGHQMQFEFWDNKLPDYTPGMHSKFECYDRGLGLIEGYADFVPIWVQNDRSDPPQGFIESPNFTFCKSPGKDNESWVAATFWDLHDSAHDGDDHIYFTNQGAVHSIFFGHGIEQDGDPYGMDDLRSVYRSLASLQHQDIVDAIFAQNDTD